jgi:hypothetical protein
MAGSIGGQPRRLMSKKARQIAQHYEEWPKTPRLWLSVRLPNSGDTAIIFLVAACQDF